MRSRWLWITAESGRRRIRLGRLSLARRTSGGGASCATPSAKWPAACTSLHGSAWRRSANAGRHRPKPPISSGLCEEALGQNAAALDTWSRIPSTDGFAHKAAIARARVLMNTGRFAPAEDLLLTLLRRSRARGRAGPAGAPVALPHRGTDCRRARADARDAGHALGSPPSCSANCTCSIMRHSRSITSRSRSRSADPNDDRVWLGKANLAAWTGRFDEASRWLERCTERRPDDEPVWRARLELAQATGDVDTVHLAAGHLSAGRFTEAEVLELRAWLAAQTGRRRDRAHGPRSRWSTVEPGKIGAWDRLAELALMAGSKDEAEGYHKRKAEINGVREQYKKLLDRDDRADHAERAGPAGGSARPAARSEGMDADRARASEQRAAGGRRRSRHAAGAASSTRCLPTCSTPAATAVRTAPPGRPSP